MTVRIAAVCSLLLLGAAPSFAQSTTSPATTTATTQTDLREYAGKYSFGNGSPISTYTITVEAGNLTGDAGMGNYKLIKLEKADQFQSTSSYGSIITFQRDPATKKVTGLTLAAQGQELVGTKEK